MTTETLLLAILTASVVLGLAIGVAALFHRPNDEGAGEVPQRFPDPPSELADRVLQLELGFKRLVDEVSEREAYAKGVWKRVRSAQRAMEEREELEESEGLPSPHAEGSPGQGVLSLHPPVDDSEQRLAAARQAVAFRGRR